MIWSVVLIASSLIVRGLAVCRYAGPASKHGSLARAQMPDLETPSASTNTTVADKLGVMYMNRIAPSGSRLWIANVDGSDAAPVMGDQLLPFDHHSAWSPDGKWILFTSERRGDGQADLYRVSTNGTTLETLVSSDSFEDAGVLSPDGSKLAYISTAINHTNNVFAKDLRTGCVTNVTGSDESVGDWSSPHSFFRPSWSPDGEWLAFSSDINTDWTGHGNGTGWEHTQTLSLYVARPDGRDFRTIAGQHGFSLGAPKWSPDGKRLVYYNISTEDTFAAHGTGQQQAGVTSQIFTVDVATGRDVVQVTSGPDLKVQPSFVGNSSTVGYLVKAGDRPGIAYTSPDARHSFICGTMRNPAWSPDGSKVLYDIYTWDQRPAGKKLFSWAAAWDYRFMDIFPTLHTPTSRLATTQKQLGNASSSVVVTTAVYTNLTTAFDVYEVPGARTGVRDYAAGLAGAFQPSWHPSGSHLAVAFGPWFFTRTKAPATLYTFPAVDGSASSYRNLTDGSLNVGFPSYSPDGSKLVYRLWNQTSGLPLGLHVLDLATGEDRAVTCGWDNLPSWSPDGQRILFTRQTSWAWAMGPRWCADRFDVCTVRPDGSGLRVLTRSKANDAHAVWTAEGGVLWSSGMYGFKEESALYDDTFQPYGRVMEMDAEGGGKRVVTDSMWEDAMPLYVPKGAL